MISSIDKFHAWAKAYSLFQANADKDCISNPELAADHMIELLDSRIDGWANEHFTKLYYPGWNSVDNLPPVRERVIITDGNVCAEAHLNHHGLFEGWTLLNDIHIGEIIYWMKLPTPPHKM